MSYSTNDNFYIDTETSIAKIQGNLDLQNSIRFNKTDNEEGIVIQANVIKDRLVEKLYINNEYGTQFNTKILDNFINSNNLSINILNINISENNTQLILNLYNKTTENIILLIKNNNYITISSSNNICFKLDTTFHNYESITSYVPYSGQSYQNLNYNQINQFDYFNGFAYGSNSIFYESINRGIYINSPLGYLTKRSTENIISYGIYLKSDGSYITDCIVNNTSEIYITLYRNINKNNLKFTNIEDTPFYNYLINIPITQNNYYILLTSHLISDPTQHSFIKYIATNGNLNVINYPKLLKINDGFISYFLTRTDVLTPITIYSLVYDQNSGLYSYVQDKYLNENIIIPGTTLADTYQYVLIKFNNDGIYQWHVRIVLKSINKNIQDPIYIISHENNEITVSLINLTITDCIIYNSDKSTNIITNFYNSFIRFTERGNYKWASKYNNVKTLHNHKSLLTSYTSNSFFANILYDNTIIDKTINTYNSDGTIFNSFNILNDVYTNNIIYYDTNGRVKHTNKYIYNYNATINNLELQTFITSDMNNNIIYGQHNLSLNNNALITYTDGFLNTNNNNFISANSINLLYYDLIIEDIGQKQLSFGNNIRVLNFQTTDLNVTGNILLEKTLLLKNIILSSNLLLNEDSRIGIGTINPRESIDITGNTLINGKIGIGTDILDSSLNITTINKNPISINNQTIIYYPTSGFFNNGYITTGAFIASIDSSNDILEYPAPPGSTYGGKSVYLSSSDNRSFYGKQKAFDKDTSTSWITTYNKYDTTTGIATSVSPTTTTVSSINYNGEWIEMYNDRKLSLNNYTINTKDMLISPEVGLGYGSPVSRPGSWIIAGSIDKTVWTLIDKRTNYLIINNSNFIVNDVNNYNYYRMIITNAAIYQGIFGGTSYGSMIGINELIYNLNNTEKNYPEYKFLNVNYKVKANSIYRYGYNDSNQYLPVNIVDDNNVGYWRSGSNEFINTQDSKEVIIEIDIHKNTIINQYSLIGQNIFTYPTKWIFEGFTSSSNWTLLDTRLLNNISSLTNSYNLESSFEYYKYRFKFYRNNSSYLNFLELKKLQFNYVDIISTLNINSNNDINLNGNVNHTGTFNFNGIVNINGSINSSLYNKVYYPGSYTIEKPLDGYHTMMVKMWGAGGGGGSGTISTIGVAGQVYGGCGGGAGGSGSYVEFSLPRHLIEYSTIQLTVGTGGNGGAGQSLFGVTIPIQGGLLYGSPGTTGTNTILTLTMNNSYNATWTAGCGGAGGGGAGSGGTGGVAGTVTGAIVGIGTSYSGLAGSAGGTNAAAVNGNPTGTTTVSLAASSGGGGSGVPTNVAQTSVLGTYGGYSTKPYAFLSGSSTLRSLRDTVSGDTLSSYGYNGFDIQSTQSGGSGGAGGYGVIYNTSSTINLKNGGNGYNGGNPGGGGGGGGAVSLTTSVLNSTNRDSTSRSGSGGSGGNGMAIITFY